MNSDRLVQLLHDLDADRRDGANVGDRLCVACVEMLAVTGAGIMLMSDGQHRGTLAVSDAAINVVEDLQFTLGEGPCIDAFTTGQPVSEPNLAHPVTHRWPGFAGPAVAAGVGAVFGFPLRVGPASVGALDVYLDQPGDLDRTQMEDALVMSEVIARTVLEIQADATSDSLAPQLRAGIQHRAGVHQASGMLSAQLNIDVGDALARIRAHAYTHNQPVGEVARGIIERWLVLD